MGVRVIALGNELACDDGAALRAAQALPGLPGCEVIAAGRPGPGLVDLLTAAAGSVPPLSERPPQAVLLLDVVRTGCKPGTIIELSLAALLEHVVTSPTLSSHGFGAAEALQLMQALGRALPTGWFVGLEGRDFTSGSELSLAVEQALPAFTARVRQRIERLARTGQPEHGLPQDNEPQDSQPQDSQPQDSEESPHA